MAFLGLSLEACTEPTRLILAMGGEKTVHRGFGPSSSAGEAILSALRSTYLDADLFLPLRPVPPAGMRIILGLD